MLAAWFAAPACAQPLVEPWVSGAAGPVDAVAAAELSGWYATASSSDDAVEIRDVRGTLVRTLTRAQINAQAPWMTLDASFDGPSALAWSDSGRLLFISVHDDVTPGDGQAGDVVLRYDVPQNQMLLFARIEVSNQTAAPAHGALLHHNGRLFVGTDTQGVRVLRAQRNDTTGVALGSGSLGGQVVRGLALDRVHGLLYAVSADGFYHGTAGASPGFVRVGDLIDARAVAYSDHFGATARHGAYVLCGQGTGASLLFVNDFQAQGVTGFAPAAYHTWSAPAHDVRATPCGRLLVGLDHGAELIADAGDPWLGFEDWVVDEFEQVVAFGRGLISPDGEPDGWVIDGDVLAGGTRFQPASPDGAAWVVLLLLAHDAIFNDPDDQIRVRRILERYAGLAPDGIAPSRSADGIYRHWIDPATGAAAPGWDGEFAVMSTMKIVLAAERASALYSDDPRIRRAAQHIIGGVSNWDAYVQPGTLFLTSLASGGPESGSAVAGYHEGVLFVEQAGVYGASAGDYAAWLNRTNWPSATYVTGMPVTSNASGNFQAAFVSLYAQIVQRGTRDSSAWTDHATALLASNGAWTDDAQARFLTVFSAGTTKPMWAPGGYNADSLSGHSGDISTFPSLMAFASRGDTAPAIGAYHAYRHGYRATFASGASILYRRSNIDPAYTPPDAGLPDVALGALGLAELIEPGVVDAVLARAFSGHVPCLPEMAPPAGVLDFFDVSAFLSAFAAHDPEADFAAPYGTFDFFDVFVFLGAFSAGCP